MQHKSLNFQIKAVSEGDEGIFEGYVSIFGNIDSYGDIMLPGSFKDTIEYFLENGLILWQHKSDVVIGKPLDAREDETGLWVKAQLILTIPKARECYELMKAGVIKKFSFGYETLEGEWLTADNIDQYLGGKDVNTRDLARALDWGRAIKKVKLYEASPVSFPANEETSLTGIKSGCTDFNLSDFTAQVKTAVQELVKAVQHDSEMRAKDNRPLSDETGAAFKQIANDLREASIALDALTNTSAKSTADQIRAIKSRVARHRAKMRQLSPTS